MLKQAIDSVIDALVEIFRIPVEAGGGLLKFADAMKLEVPNQARPWASVLVAIFIIVLPFVLDRCRSVTSRLILAYGILCLAFLIVVVATSSILTVRLARFEVQGSFKLKALQDDPKSMVFPPIRYGNDSCDANEVHTNRVCSGGVAEFTNATATISSANCGSGIKSVEVDPADKTCIIAVSHLQGCGYDHLPLHINNCRGRGWIEFSINGTGTTRAEHIIHEGPVAGPLTAQQPLTIDLGKNPLGTNDKVEYKFDILSESNVVAELTNSVPSQGNFSTSLLPNGKLQVSYGKLQAN